MEEKSTTRNEGDFKVESLKDLNLHENEMALLSEVSSVQKPEDLYDRFSYAYGNLFASSLLDNETDVDIIYFLRGIIDYYGDSFFSDEEIDEIFTEYQADQLSLAEKRYEEKKKENLESAEVFLEANAKRSPVRLTDSGLEYEIVKEGTGESPKEDDVVLADYTITLLDGSVVDSSYDRGEPSTLEVHKMLKGIREALMTMKEGGVSRFWIHPSLAYGENGISIIGPNELIIFEVELYEIL